MGPPGWKGRVDDSVYRRTSMLRWPHGRENKPNLHETNDGGKKKTSLPKGLGRHSHGIKVPRCKCPWCRAGSTKLFNGTHITP